MNNSQSLIVDFSQEKALSKFLPLQSFEKTYQTELPGQGLIYQGHPACEYKEHSLQQHGIVVHLKPEFNSLRSLGERVEVENVSVGDMAIIPANVNHWQRIETKVCEAMILTIDPQLLARFARETIKPERVELLPTFAQSDPLIYGIILNIKANLDSGSYDRLYAESLYHALFHHLLKNYCTRHFKPIVYKEGLVPYKLKQVAELINDNLAEEITIEQMAATVDLSLSYFSRQFKLATGLTPHQYVMQQRFERAKQLLKDRKLSLSAVANECGFTHQSHMGKLFRQQLGVTPKQYRDEVTR